MGIVPATLLQIPCEYTRTQAHKAHSSAWPPESARAVCDAVLKLCGFFVSSAESGRPLLKELQHVTSKQSPLEKHVAKLSFLLSRVPFQDLSGFMWIELEHIGAPICYRRPLVFS